MSNINAFITKYALTSGIHEVPVEVKDHYAYSRSNGCHIQIQYCPNEWHETFEEALADAEKRRSAKITSLTKQIERLKKLKFERP